MNDFTVIPHDRTQAVASYLKLARFYLNREPLLSHDEFMRLRNEIDKCIPCLEVLDDTVRRTND